ncbi:MAG: ABC transporter substrate-binding protein [Pseudomonadota bacterium]
MTRFMTAALVTTTLATGALAESHDPRPELTIAMPALQRSHPAVCEANFCSRVSKSVFDGLLNRDWLAGPNGNDGTEIVPGIFTEWEQIDELTWEFKLRPGVKFHHGPEVTAEDVAFTISAERLWGENPIRPHSMASSLAEVTVVDDETIKVVTMYPDPVLLHRLAHTVGHVVPAELYRERGYEGFGAAPVGTGPYRWVESAADDYIVLEAFDEYWGGTPPFSKITFRAVPETSARIAGMITGDYDIITSIPPDQAELIDREDEYETRSIEVENMHQLTFIAGCGQENAACERESPVHDPLIRKAMVVSVDREQIADRLWNGLAKVPAGPNWPMYGDLYDADRDPLGYDPEEAKRLMEEAGYDGEEIKVVVTAGYYVNGDRAMQVMLQMWEEVGLNVQLQFVENWSQQTPYGWQDAFLTSSNIRIPDPLSPFWWRFGEKSASFAVRGIIAPTEEHTRTGNILERTLDQEARIEAFHAGLDEWQEQNPAIIMYRPIEIYGVRTDLEWTPYSFYWMDFRDYNVSFADQ